VARVSKDGGGAEVASCFETHRSATVLLKLRGTLALRCSSAWGRTACESAV